MGRSLPEIESATIKKSYELTFVSPMAMHGANAKREAEFRTSSFKGILRYWWRSLQLEYDSTNLLKEEERLFGGTTTANKRKSPVSFSLLKPVKGNKKVNMLPHKNVFVPVQSIESDYTVTLIMYVLRKDQEALSLYENYLNFMLHLAGMGQRARRGFGACQWSEHQWENEQEFAQSLKKSLMLLHVDKQFSWSDKGSCLLERKSPAQAAHPIINAVYIGAGKESVQQILTDIGRASHFGNGYGSLGSTKPRWASPLWCTIRKIGRLYYPIITEMKSEGEIIRNKRTYERDRETFLREVGVKL